MNNFDHLSFPGVVPRSFLPSAILANLCKPIHLLHSYLSSSSNLLPPPTPPTYSTISRFILGLLQAHATTSLSSALPPPTQTPFLLLSSLQPHLNFYASRFLPNSFALLLTTHAFACWFNQSPYSTISLLTIAAATTRCDMLVLAAPIGISLLLNSKVTLLKGILTGIFTLTLTFLFIIPLDTVMWNNYSSPMLPPLPFLWAEGVVLFYNTVENKSANWGTSPPYWYLVAMLKALLGCFFFAMLGVFKLRPTPAPPSPHKDQIFSLFNIQVYLNKHLLGYLFPAAVFVALYSILPHKELRFILPAFPIFNVAAAEGLAGVWSVVFFKAKVDCESSSKVVSPVSTRLRRRKAGATTETTTTTTKTKPQTHHHPPKIISLLLALGSFLLLLFTFLGTAVFLAASHNNYPGGEVIYI
ncbi:hypothetical protein TL16_g02061 [Triparma laevis f. inornata]|uniref:Mannosyltransferase n=1 Tax=Triparma laevis f. inornata TaxID=1714386 RepID=A0A9W6ZT17_9STRA|nr:hypothetical protein TL16_g02061 [Triparma laevis f. inornata]